MPTIALPVPARSAPASIVACLNDHHVLSICVCDANGPWAASCFYAFDANTMDLVVLTSLTTRHGRRMEEAPLIAGTIAAQPQGVTGIRGIQFTATAELLSGPDRSRMRKLYIQRHPMALLRKSDVWTLHLDEVKYTENKLAFAQKLHWRRNDEMENTPD